MRDLTKSELEEYFCFARDDKKAGDFHLDQTQLVGNVLLSAGLLKTAAVKMLMALSEGMDPHDVLVSFWVLAFQMGRECESRLITTALKGGKR